jgi:hypothetical protein
MPVVNQRSLPCDAKQEQPRSAQQTLRVGDMHHENTLLPAMW